MAGVFLKGLGARGGSKWGPKIAQTFRGTEISCDTQLFIIPVAESIRGKIKCHNLASLRRQIQGFSYVSEMLRRF